MTLQKVHHLWGQTAWILVLALLLIRYVTWVGSTALLH